MLETPHIISIATRLTSVIHLKVPRQEIRSAMGPGISELMATLAAQGIAPSGPRFTHHLKMAPDSWDFEIGVPVGAPVAAAGRVRPSEWPAMKAARTVYHGPYEGLADAWGQFLSWIAANGHMPAPDLYECYVAGPESSPDPVNWRTEFTKPLTD